MKEDIEFFQMHPRYKSLNRMVVKTTVKVCIKNSCNASGCRAHSRQRGKKRGEMN